MSRILGLQDLLLTRKLRVVLVIVALKVIGNNAGRLNWKLTEERNSKNNRKQVQENTWLNAIEKKEYRDVNKFDKLKSVDELRRIVKKCKIWHEYMLRCRCVL